ncbi:MAG: glycosyltransferase family 4 protein [Bacteroidota bacterium]
MNILLVSKSLPHNFQGGIQTHVWKLSEHLLRRGHEVSILTAGSWNKGIQRRSLEGRHLIELPYLPGRKLPFLSVSAEEFSFNLAARRWLLKNQTLFDLIHLQGRSGALFLKNKAQIKTPVVSTFHGLISIEQDKAKGKQASFDQKMHRLVATKMEDRTLQNAQALIAISGEMQAAMEARQPAAAGKIRRIYNGIDVPEIGDWRLVTGDLDAPNHPSPITNHPSPITNHPSQILFVGRLTALKGVFPLVEAMKKVRRDIRLVLVGDGDARPELEKLVLKNGLQDRIHFAGALDSEQVKAWMRHCSALILPSYYETQGIVLMEANALGKPVIGVAVGGVPEVIKNRKNGLLLSDNRPETLAWGINHLFENEELAKKWGAWGRGFVQEKFAWGNIARQTEELYERLLQTANRPQIPAEISFRMPAPQEKVFQGEVFFRDVSPR